ncbi:MAG: protoheme IX farnesyltransferase [Nitrospirae bacterium]|nr:protoheme IX farnesyltransferase [Nitrospirota bacterium]
MTAGPLAYAGLCRIRVSLMAGLSAMTGYQLAAFSFKAEVLLIGSGVFLLSCGASALNQYQEQDMDALMERTKGRPLPSGKIKGHEALIFSAASALAGVALIFPAGGLPPVLLGLFAVIWYNGLYTGLKRRSAFAAVPGALVGAVPPALGWSAGGGGFFDPAMAVLCVFFFLWQVPHFWLFAADKGGEYKRAGVPVITACFSGRRLSGIIFAWIAGLSVNTVFFAPYGLTLHAAAGYLLIAASIWMLLEGARLIGKGAGQAPYRRVSVLLNLYPLAVVMVLFTDRIALIAAPLR